MRPVRDDDRLERPFDYDAALDALDCDDAGEPSPDPPPANAAAWYDAGRCRNTGKRRAVCLCDACASRCAADARRAQSARADASWARKARAEREAELDAIRRAGKPAVSCAAAAEGDDDDGAEAEAEAKAKAEAERLLTTSAVQPMVRNGLIAQRRAEQEARMREATRERQLDEARALQARDNRERAAEAAEAHGGDAARARSEAHRQWELDRQARVASRAEAARERSMREWIDEQRRTRDMLGARLFRLEIRPGPSEASTSSEIENGNNSNNSNNSNPQCSICQDDIETGQSIETLPCAHPFHEWCISPWLAENDTCPVCRARVQ